MQVFEDALLFHGPLFVSQINIDQTERVVSIRIFRFNLKSFLTGLDCFGITPAVVIDESQIGMRLDIVRLEADGSNIDLDGFNVASQVAVNKSQIDVGLGEVWGDFNRALVIGLIQIDAGFESEAPEIARVLVTQTVEWKEAFNGGGDARPYATWAESPGFWLCTSPPTKAIRSPIGEIAKRLS